MNQCSEELLEKLNNLQITENSVHLFHINNNENNKMCNEPTTEQTTKMIYHFLTFIYQRNVLSSLVKYILLKDLLNKFENFPHIKRGIFSHLYKRLNAIIFECNITAFNGSNYDNYLLCNSLLIIQSKLKQKMFTFKKGASISTMYLSFKHNLNKINNSLTNSAKIKKSKFADKWSLQLYFKDIRNLVAANMSLDKIGKLFNLPVSKLCFPYNQALSIKKLKEIDSLHPNDNAFWHDTFSTKVIPIEQRLAAQVLFTEKKFKNLYEYNMYYLKLDCVLLHSIVLTLFRNYLLDHINIFLRRNYSQSSLSYEQFFIIEPSQQINFNNAPKMINNTFMNYFIKSAITGGLCTSFVHGSISKDTTIINEHLKYVDPSNYNKKIWPNLHSSNLWKTMFNEKPAGISTIDIRSLYPSAAIKKIPVGTPLLFSRFVPQDFFHVKNKNLFIYNIHSFCTTTQREGNHNNDFFKLLNKPVYLRYEYNALELYLKHSLPNNIKILRFQSNFTAFGQLFINNIPVDGFLSYYNYSDKKIYIKILQYNSVRFHGHTEMCMLPNSDIENMYANRTKIVKQKITSIFNDFIDHFNLSHVNFEYVEISECNYETHCIPQIKPNISYNSYYTYNSFLESIYSNQINGFLVVKNLEIKHQNQNPFFGFIIQKADYDVNKISPYSQSQIKKFLKTPRVVSLHKSKSFMVISTEYFRWLHKIFGFEQTPDIYHALLFQTEHYLRGSIENKLKQRQILKGMIKKETNTDLRQTMEIKSELIKLMLNSCYGFTLCNVNSEKFKKFHILFKVPKSNKYNSCIKLNDKTYLVESKKNAEYPHQTLLGHVGCSILFHSKIILLKRLFYLLKYLNPCKAQLLYMDTDSAHFLVKHENFVDNVDSQLQLSFMNLFNKHFETGSKISGIWVQEGFFEYGEYIGEKSYKLKHSNNKSLIHMKGLNSYFQNTLSSQTIDLQTNPCIAYNLFMKSPDFLLFKVHMSKDLFSNYVPIKRYFVCANGSLPLKL